MSSSPMNYSMVKRLILKDWHFQRWAILGYLVAGALSLALVAYAVIFACRELSQPCRYRAS